MTESTTSQAAHQDWTERITRRSDPAAGVELPVLAPPTGLSATGGVGQVTLGWDPVEGAVGYLLHRATAADGPFAAVDHHSQDVLSVPRSPYVDTTGEIGTTYWYAVSSVPEVTTHGPLSAPVPAASQPPAATLPTVTVVVAADAVGVDLNRPWEPMIGSERLSQLLCTELSGGRPIGAELRAALIRMHDEIGVRTVRAHAIFHDDTNVYREVDGVPVHDFSVVDRIYDILLEIGLRPVVEIGFMPTDLALDPSKTVFGYRAHISPPKDYGRWADLVSALVQHLVDRYGREEVTGWDFEVWNEANLEVFWSGTKAEWMHLYDVTARAVKSVDERIPVGGPSSAAAGWVDDLLAHCRSSGSPVDFVSTHTYGSPPLDVRASLRRHGFDGARVLWTEWGVTPTHFNPVNDTVFAGIFLLRGMRSAAGTIDALSYWVASDHFEELGRPPRLLHGGFGLQTVGGIAKPRFHAMAMLAALGTTELPVRVDGDGAGSLVEIWAGRRSTGEITVLIWNLTLDQDKAGGDAALTRHIDLTLTGLGSGSWAVELAELSIGHGDIAYSAAKLGVDEWPAADQWAELAERSRPAGTSTVAATQDGTISIEFDLTMPAAMLYTLRRVETHQGEDSDGTF